MPLLLIALIHKGNTMKAIYNNSIVNYDSEGIYVGMLLQDIEDRDYKSTINRVHKLIRYGKLLRKRRILNGY